MEKLIREEMNLLEESAILVLMDIVEADINFDEAIELFNIDPEQSCEMIANALVERR
jgi:dihydroxyacetone kinase DhaKLM complex PTS-EIIA-like component DhaM